MTDIVNPATRSKMMSGIKDKNTKPETIVRKYLYARGLRYRLHVNNLPGKPDIVLAKYKTVIFVHGCFWHRHAHCKYAYTPRSRTDFWETKFSENVARDEYQIHALKQMGWHVLVVWECELSKNLLRLDLLYSEITREVI